MKIKLYREINSLLREARKLHPMDARIPYHAASILAGYAYEAKIICPAEYLKIMEHIQKHRTPIPVGGGCR